MHRCVFIIVFSHSICLFLEVSYVKDKLNPIKFSFGSDVWVPGKKYWARVLCFVHSLTLHGDDGFLKDTVTRNSTYFALQLPGEEASFCIVLSEACKLAKEGDEPPSADEYCRLKVLIFYLFYFLRAA